ncbi:MAG: hypothetical protein EA397_00320 [Deltaproteobacteria bacterium]|nr:MAG: hypothetical protein EA397_00320 [Deltaproteobacteria bacterium]
MHLLDRLHWVFARLLPAVDVDALRDIPMAAEDERIGPSWPARFAASQGEPLRPLPDGGLVDLARLAGPNVDPEALSQAIVDFYHHTARYSLEVDVRWRFPFSLAVGIFGALYGRRWGQLELPFRNGSGLTNELFGVGPHRLWVRCYEGTDRALYVSCYEAASVPSEPDPVVRIAFPIPGGAWAVIFRVVQEGERLVLTERGGRPGGPGLYVVRAGARPRYVRWLREEIEVNPEPGGASARHRLWVFGVLVLTLLYELPSGGVMASGSSAPPEPSLPTGEAS